MANMSFILVFASFYLLTMSIMGLPLEEKDKTKPPSSYPVKSKDSDELAGDSNQSSTEECREPLENQLEAMIIKFNPGPSLNYEHIGNNYTEDEGKCDTIREANVNIGTPLNKRSTCPWTIKNHFDKNRYPSDISYAECNCKSCHNRGGICKPVTQPRLVLNKGKCVKGVYQYTPSMVNVNVACVCSRSSTS